MSTPNKIIPFQTILDAKIDHISGMTMKEVSIKHNLSITTLEDRFARIDAITSSTLPAITTEQKIISEALSDHLKPIKEQLSLKSLDIIRLADDLVEQKLKNNTEDITIKDAIKASEAFSNRLAHLTGIEEAPAQQNNNDKTVVNTYIQNIFNRLIPEEKQKEKEQPIDITPNEMV